MSYWSRCFASVAAALGLLACELEVTSPSDDAPGGASGDGGTGALGPGGDGGSAGSTVGGGGAGAGVTTGIAPDGAVEGEHPGEDGDNVVTASPGTDDVLRVDAEPDEHIGFVLSFDTSSSDVELELTRWDGGSPVVLGYTDAGAGLRTLAAFDSSEPRTFWIRVRTTRDAFEGTLAITRTPFSDGPACDEDCDRLLQLPLRNDPAFDGYDWTSSTIFRYQFGRRDLVMFLRHAARTMALAGRSPILPEDLSQWDGQTPGIDVGAPRHASHQDGKDVDISLYGTDGLALWRSYCDVEYKSDGRECIPGTAADFDGRANAELFGAFLQSQRVTMSFLDGELIPLVQLGAEDAVDADALDATLLPLYSDGQHLQHWPNHDNHIHVRVSEAEYGASALAPEPFAAP